MVIKASRKKLTRREVRNVISKFQARLNDEQIDVERVLLFGSYARGSAHRDSDIDVAVIMPPRVPAQTRRKIPHIPWFAKQVHVKLEPHILSERDMRNRWLSLPAEVKRFGVKVR